MTPACDLTPGVNFFLIDAVAVPTSISPSARTEQSVCEIRPSRRSRREVIMNFHPTKMRRSGWVAVLLAAGAVGTAGGTTAFAYLPAGKSFGWGVVDVSGHADAPEPPSPSASTSSSPEPTPTAIESASVPTATGSTAPASEPLPHSPTPPAPLPPPLSPLPSPLLSPPSGPSLSEPASSGSETTSTGPSPSGPQPDPSLFPSSPDAGPSAAAAPEISPPDYVRSFTLVPG